MPVYHSTSVKFYGSFFVKKFVLFFSVSFLVLFSLLSSCVVLCLSLFHFILSCPFLCQALFPLHVSSMPWELGRTEGVSRNIGGGSEGLGCSK